MGNCDFPAHQVGIPGSVLGMSLSVIKEGEATVLYPTAQGDG